MHSIYKPLKLQQEARKSNNVSTEKCQVFQENFTSRYFKILRSIKTQLWYALHENELTQTSLIILYKNQCDHFSMPLIKIWHSRELKSFH